MSSSPITSVFNDGYIAEQYEAYRRDPNSVDESWRQYFRVAESLGAAGLVAGAPAAGAPAAGGAGGDASLATTAAGAMALIQAIRAYGHLAVAIDPLGSPPIGAPGEAQNLFRVTRLGDDEWAEENLGSVRFVPLIGEEGWRE